MGPLLFLIYINDITVDIKSEIFLYADDATLLKVITDPRQGIQEINLDLQILSEWANQWAVIFSASKSNLMILSKKPAQVLYDDVVFNHKTISRVREYQHLGITFSDNMTWESHIPQAKTAFYEIIEQPGCIFQKCSLSLPHI